MKSFKTLLLFLFIITTGSSAPAQTGYDIKWFTDDSGLPQNSIKSIFKDKYGYIWLSTESGLVRFDGTDFKIFNSENTPAISHNRMWFFDGNIKTDSIYTVSYENLLLITQRQVKKVPDSLHHFLNRKSFGIEVEFSNYDAHSSHLNYLPSNPIYQIYPHESGYFSVSTDSIWEYDKNNRLKHNYGFSFAETSQAFLFSNDLYILNNKQDLFLLKNGNIYPISFDRNLSGNNKTIYKNNTSNQIFLKINNNLYLIESIRNGKTKTRLLLEDFKFGGSRITSVFFDTDNDILYLGSATLGLCVVKKHKFSNLMLRNQRYNVEYGLGGWDEFTTISATGLVIRDKKIIAEIDAFSIADDYNILIDKNKNAWMKGYKTVYFFQRNNGFDYRLKDSWDFNEPLSTLYMRDNGMLWIGTLNHGYLEKGVLYSINTNEDIFIPKKILDADFDISVIEEIDKENFLFGSKKGAHKAKIIDGKPEEITRIIDSADIRSIYKDKNSFWITSYDKGIFLYKDEKVTSFPLDKNKYLATSHCIVEDKNGYFWITTNKGIFQVQKKTLLDYADKKTTEVYYQYYDKRYGFHGNEFNGGGYPCGVILENGDVYFPSLTGIVAFSSSETDHNNAEYDIYIDEVEVDGIRHSFFNDTITIDRNFERIKFFISSPFYGHPYNIKMEIELNGSEKQNWTPVDNDQSISYTSLPPGIYTLTARKLSGLGLDYRYKSITIIIPPAFWQTLWFKTLLLLLLIGLIFLTIHLRTKYVENENLLLEKEVEIHTKQLKAAVKSLTIAKGNLKKQVWFQKNMISSISHDLKTPMKYLEMTSKHIYENYETSKGEEYENIELIYNSSSQMVHFIDKLLIYARANISEITDTFEIFNLYNTVQECISFFTLAASSHSNVIYNNISKGLDIKSNKQLLKIVIQNLIDNAIKNTSKGTIRIDAYLTKSEILITVEDNGKGIPKKELNLYKGLFAGKSGTKKVKKVNGLGLKIIRELLVILKGEITVDSIEGKGTIFTLSLSRKDSYHS